MASHSNLNPPKKNKMPADWLVSNNETSELIRSIDWSATPLGPRDSWPQSLCTVVNLIMSSNFPMAILWGQDLIFIYNDAYRIIAAAKHPNALGQSTREVWPEVWNFNKSVFERVMQQGETIDFHDQLFRIDREGYKEDAYFTLSYSPIHTEGKQVGGTLVVLIETTERVILEQQLQKSKETLELQVAEQKRTTEELRESEANLARAQAIVHLANWEVHVGTTTVRGSNELYRLFNLKPDRALEAYVEKFHPDDRQRVVESINAAIYEGKPYSTDYRIVPDPGEIRHVHAEGEVIRDNEGRPRTFFGTVQDITERKQAEEKLRESEQLYHAIGESIDYGIWVCNPDGQNIYASKSFLNLVGITQEQCSNFGWGDVLHPDDAERTIASWKECVRTGSVWDIEHRFRGVDGQWHPVLARGVPVRNEQGEIIYWAGINLDISNLKMSEMSLKERTQQLEDANKELETFSYSISHDLREPLRAIEGFSRMLLRDLQDKLDDDSRRKFEVIREKTRRMDQLIQDVLTFSCLSGQTVTLNVINFEPQVTEAWKEILDNHPKRNIKLNMSALVPCGADKDMIRQVFVNLLSNAVKFTQTREQALVEVGCEEKANECVFYVKDNGVGFDMNFADKLFMLFQRLHSAEEFAGTGVGLSFVKRIINRHGGKIWAEGKVNEGATFYFSLRKDI